MMKYYFWGHPIIRDCFNFGDLISPLLMEYYCKDKDIQMATSAVDADIFCVGSIIEHIPQNKFVVILGSGMIKADTPAMPMALCYALRGPHTKKRMGIKNDIPLGDPALLVPSVLPKSNTPNPGGPIGIVPHAVHYDNPRIDRFRNDSAYKIIDVRRDAESVVDDICQCSAIISSSLHGLIIADAYGIPNIRLIFEQALCGGDFKFNDYNDAIGRQGAAARAIEPEDISEELVFETDYFGNIPAIQRKLDDAFKRFAADLPLLSEFCTIICKIKDLEKRKRTIAYRMLYLRHKVYTKLKATYRKLRSVVSKIRVIPPERN